MDIMYEPYFSVDLPTGVTLGARIWRPVDAEQNPVPVVIDFHPYRSCDYSAVGDSMRYSLLASKGYACVKLDCRGTGNSTGFHSDQFDDDYWNDGAAAVEWFARQPWSNGKVGMVGVSWPAHASLMVATKRPPSLAAIVPMTAADDRYLNRYQGGCLLLYTVVWGSMLGSQQTRPPLPFVVGDSWKRIWKERLDAFNNFFEKWIAHPTFDDYWLAGSAADDLSRIECPVLSVAGWADPGYSVTVPRLLNGLSVPVRSIIGPWGHRWPNDALPGPGIDMMGHIDTWFGQWLKGEENGVLDQPAMTAWILDGIPADANRKEWPGYWVREDVWPSPNISMRPLALTADRRLEDKPGQAAKIDVRSPLSVGAHAGEWMPCFPTGPQLAEDQREDDASSLVFDSAPLEEDMVLLGSPTIELDVSSNRPGGQIVVRLCDVDPDTGSSSRITYGFLNFAHREGDVRAVPVTPGEVMRIGIELFPMGYRVRKGHRLRIAISTCYWPIIWPAREDATLTVHLGGESRINLPVRTPNRDAVDADLGKPENGASVPFTQLRAPGLTRNRHFDVGTGHLTTIIEEDGGASRLEDDKLEVGVSHVRRYDVNVNDPLSAACQTKSHWTMRREEWEISIVVEAEVTADHDNFHVSTKVEAFEGRDQFYVRNSSKSIARTSV